MMNNKTSSTSTSNRSNRIIQQEGEKEEEEAKEQEGIVDESLNVSLLEDDDDDEEDDDKVGPLPSTGNHSIRSSSDGDNGGGGDTSRSHDDTSGSGSGTTTIVEKEQKHHQTTTKALSMVRLMFVTTLFTLAAIVSNVTFIIAHNKEEVVFETQMEWYATTMEQSLRYQLEQQFWMADTLATEWSILSSSSSSTTTSSSWPYSIPHFDTYCHPIQQLLQSSTIWWAPLLRSETERIKWEAYAMQFEEKEASTSSTNTSTASSSSSSSSSSVSPSTGTTYYHTGRTASQGIYHMNQGQAITTTSSTTDTESSSSTTTTWYAPIWQIATSSQVRTTTTTTTPTTTTTSVPSQKKKKEDASSLKLFNQFSESIRATALQQMIQTQGAVWSQIMVDSTIDSIHAQYETPTSAFYYPILVVSNNNNNNNNNNTNTMHLHGALTISIHWQALLEKALSTFVIENPMILVLENSCGQVYSYSVAARGGNYPPQEDGATTVVRYLGTGDGYHNKLLEAPYTNSTYLDFLEPISVPSSSSSSSSSVSSSSSSTSVMEDEEDDKDDSERDEDLTLEETDTSDTNGRDLFPPSSGTCHQYRFRLHPTVTLKQQFVTNRPAYLQGGIAMVFLFTCAIFIAYDCLVERRNRILVASAQQTRAIVNSLFPSTVRDRLYAEHSEKQKQQKQLKASLANMQTPKLRLKSFLDGTNNSGNGNGGNGTGGGGGGGGIRRRTSASGTSIMTSSSSMKRDGSYGAQGLADMLANSEPIADLFPRATVLSADISGFTAWSSEREPSQVFTLLESMFGVMDKAAQKLHVFKVETIGDCYVAATGLPDPQPDHAVRMARFAHLCLQRIQKLVQALEASLGPGTGDLSMRFGIHSGPVTAGVLRGEKSRFQLFGDTLDLASQMESTGIKNKIQLSQDTAELLVQSGKSHWIVPRNDDVASKSKDKDNTIGEEQSPDGVGASVGGAGGGETWTVLHNGKSIQTFWLQLEEATSSSNGNGNGGGGGRRTSSKFLTLPILNTRLDSLGVSMMDDEMDELVDWGDADVPSKPEKNMAEAEQVQRLIDWNVEELMSILRRVVARRNAILQGNKEKKMESRRSRSSSVSSETSATFSATGDHPLDEVKEVVTLPEFDPSLPGLKATDAAVKLSKDVQRELRDYVSQIAAGYKDNPFHNFEHASHVCLSSNKLLKRILQSDAVDYAMASKGRTISDVASDLHNHTYGISSDPLTHLAIVFSALIHDVGHTGVPNATLAKELPEIAARYYNQSIAEQRSVDIAWELLMAPCYGTLRSCIFATDKERVQFRSLVVNNVMATDIFDKELGALRKARWDKAFANSSTTNKSATNNNNNHQADESTEVKDLLRESQNVILDSSSSFDGDDPKLMSENQRIKWNTDMNRKATIVIEHIIQASDVSHTMQHWHIYQRWNERLFCEMYRAYQAGRAADPTNNKDPSEGWYKGELWFFDNYVIPLAHKLKDCGVFGVSCDEYLNYAVTNRAEWERKGNDVVANMVAKLQQ
jgi:class 3 adenylate cyclase